MDKLIREEHKKYGKVETPYQLLGLSWSSMKPDHINFTLADTNFSISFPNCEHLVKVLEAMGALPNLEICDKVVTNG